MKKRFLLMIACLILLCVLSMPVSAASLTKSQKQVKKAVTTLMKNCKNYSPAKIRKCFVKPNKAKVYYKEKNVAKFFKKINKEKYFKYSIEDVKVQGKKATVKVNIEYWFYILFFSEVSYDCKHYLKYTSNVSFSSFDKQMYKFMLHDWRYYGASVYQICTCEGIYNEPKSTTVTLKLKKINGKWKVTSMPFKFRDAIHGGFETIKIIYDWDEWNKWIY